MNPVINNNPITACNLKVPWEKFLVTSLDKVVLISIKKAKIATNIKTIPLITLIGLALNLHCILE